MQFRISFLQQALHKYGSYSASTARRVTTARHIGSWNKIHQYPLASRRHESSSPTSPGKNHNAQPWERPPGTPIGTSELVECLERSRAAGANLPKSNYPPPKYLHEIESSLNHSNIKPWPGAPWGFIVFRTAYGGDSDALWTRTLQKMYNSIVDTLIEAEQADLLDRLELTVIDDEKTLAGADSHTVRQAFREWVADDLTQRLTDKYIEEHGGVSKVHAKLRGNEPHSKHPVAGLPPRWIYCIVLDEECLSYVNIGTATYSGFPMKILTTNWQKGRVSAVAEGWADGATDDQDEEVGWMYIERDEYVDWYNSLENQRGWDITYERPQELPGPIASLLF